MRPQQQNVPKVPPLLPRVTQPTPSIVQVLF